jgi:hypothetical protein
LHCRTRVLSFINVSKRLGEGIAGICGRRAPHGNHPDARFVKDLFGRRIANAVISQGFQHFVGAVLGNGGSGRACGKVAIENGIAFERLTQIAGFGAID